MDTKEEQARIIVETACTMYSTAAQLSNSGMITDADSVAKKAKLLLNKGLSILSIEVPTNES